MSWEPELDELRRELADGWAHRAHELVALDAPAGPVARGTRP
jgi:hypothetical protein